MLLRTAPFPHPIALAFGGNHRGVMRQSIQQCRGEFFIAGEHRDPFREREIGGDDGRAPLVALADEIEQQLAADAIERHEPQLVDDQDLAST